ncbi:hypothetical protein [Variovorax sp. CAN15]|uniref:hypothetical protein n=1 Tax=Variovorax sp. CAN15 TaxID=3046727 RepID=UPI00264A2FFB|nr:hypothetical protein [Variovorax sp. CAN15]
MKYSLMNKKIILESLTRALESWVRNASAAQLWQVHQAGGLGALIQADEEVVQVRIVLGGVRDALSDIGKTDGRLPVTEAFLGTAAWGAPPAQGSPAREQWFLSSELAQAHARQYVAAEVSERRDLLERCVDDWTARQSAAFGSGS